MCRTLKHVSLLATLIMLKMGYSGLFFFIFVFSTVICSIQNFVDDWISTADLWYRKRPLCQLSHSYCPKWGTFYGNQSYDFRNQVPQNSSRNVRFWSCAPARLSKLNIKTKILFSKNSYFVLGPPGDKKSSIRKKKKCNTLNL